METRLNVKGNTFRKRMKDILLLLLKTFIKLFVLVSFSCQVVSEILTSTGLCRPNLCLCFHKNTAYSRFLSQFPHTSYFILYIKPESRWCFM